MQNRARREEEERCSDGTIRSSRRLRTRAPIDTGTDSSRMQQQKKAAPPSRSRNHIRKSGRYEGRFRPKTKVQYVSKWRVIRNGYRGFSNGFHRSVHAHQYFFFSPLCCLCLHCMYTYCGTCPLPMMEVSVHVLEVTPTCMCITMNFTRITGCASQVRYSQAVRQFPGEGQLDRGCSPRFLYGGFGRIGEGRRGRRSHSDLWNCYIYKC